MDAFEKRVRDWTRFIEWWSYNQECKYPGVDFWPSASQALLIAANTFDPSRGRFFRWLHANLRNEMAPVLATHRRRRAKLTRLPLLGTEPDRFDDFDRIEVADEVAPYLTALESLPPRQSEAVRRVVMGGESVADVARSWGVARGTVDVPVRRGLDRLRTLK